MDELDHLVRDAEADLLETAAAYVRTFALQLEGQTPVVSGDLVGSYRYVVAGAEHQEAAAAAAAIRSLDDTVEVWSTDPAYAVLDLGVHVSRDGRRRGSPKAPRGLTAPAALAADRIVEARP